MFLVLNHNRIVFLCISIYYVIILYPLASELILDEEDPSMQITWEIQQIFCSCKFFPADLHHLINGDNVQ